MSGFAGVLLSKGSASAIPLTAMAPGDYQTFPTDAACDIAFRPDGVILRNGNSYSGPTNWFDPFSGSPPLYWIKLVVDSGSTPSGDLTNTVLSLSAQRGWAITETGLGSVISNCTISIYNDAAGANLVTSATCTFTASSTSP